MPSSTQRLRAWLNHPDQRFALNELQWLRRWIARPPGLVWLAIYIISFAGANAAAVLIHRTLDQLLVMVYSILSAGLGFASTLVLYGIWIMLIHQRSLRMMRPDRLRDLLTTPTGPKELWPALLAAPLVLLWALSVVSFIVQLIAMVLNPVEANVFAGLLARLRPTMHVSAIERWTLWAIEILVWFSPLIIFVFGLFWSMALTAYAVRASLPRGGPMRIIIHLALGSIFTYLPATFVVVITMIRGAFTPPSLAGGGDMKALVIYFGAVPLLMALSTWVLWRYSIGWLRSEKGFERLRAYAEKG